MPESLLPSEFIALEVNNAGNIACVTRFLDGSQGVVMATNVACELDDDVDCDFNNIEELDKVFDTATPHPQNDNSMDNVMA